MQWVVNFWSLLPQEFAEADSTSRFKKGLDMHGPKVYKWIRRGLSNDIPCNILDATALGEYKVNGEQSVTRLLFLNRCPVVTV